MKNIYYGQQLISVSQTAAKSLIGGIVEFQFLHLHEGNWLQITNSKHFFTEEVNISAFHCTQWKSCCLETLMQLNVTINDITVTTFQSQLVFLPRCAIHTHSTTYRKFDDIINCRHKESKSEIEYKFKGKLLLSVIYQQSNDLHLRPVTCDVCMCSVPAKFRFFLQVPSSQKHQRNQTTELSWGLNCLVVLFLLLYVICASCFGTHRRNPNLIPVSL